MTPPSDKQHLATAQRDENRERVWLELAELDAGESGFADHAHRRLAAGEELYGDRWAHIGIERLIDELLAEAADLGAWSCLALEALEHEAGPCVAERELIASALWAVQLWGAYAHHALAIARAHATGLAA